MALEQNLADSCNPEEFIKEIKKFSAIWDVTSDDYCDKLSRRKAWESVTGKFVSNFSHLSSAEKNNMVNAYQRKWKSLRDSYAREKSKQSKEKAGSAGKFRRQYIFFEQLRFLDTGVKNTVNSPTVTKKEKPQVVDEEGPNSDVHISTDTFKPTTETFTSNIGQKSNSRLSFTKAATFHSKKRKSKDSDRHLEDTLHTISQSNSSDEFDAFGTCVALHLKKMPLQDALELQTEILNVISRKRIQILNRGTTTVRTVSPWSTTDDSNN